MRVVFSLLLATWLLLWLALPGAAAGGLTVFGGKIETVVIPGSSTTFTMEVANTTDAPMDIGVEVKGYGMSTSQDFIVLEPEDDTSLYSAFALLRISPMTFRLEPSKSQTVTITTNIPNEIGNGGRYAIVFIHTIPQPGGAVGVISAVAARVLLTISGSTLNTSSRITEASLVKSTPQQPAGMTVTVANNGNHHFKPEIQATLRYGNKVVATTPVTAPGWPIIPSYSRQFKLDLIGPSPLAAGIYQVDVEVKDESGALITRSTFSMELTENQVITISGATLPSTTTLSATPTSALPTPTMPPAASKLFPVLLLASSAGTAIVAVIMIVLGRKRKHMR